MGCASGELVRHVLRELHEYSELLQDRIAEAEVSSLTGEPCRESPGTLAINCGVRVACADEWLGLETVILPEGAIEPANVLACMGRLSEAA
jgi:hypothetical protein